jgi:hypothetical protein
MIRHLCICSGLVLVSAALPLRAANRPQAGTDSHDPVVWTNDDLARLHSLSLVSIVGQINEEKPNSGSLPAGYVTIQDPAWYAEQAARLRDELEHRQAQLRDYRQAIVDARSLRESTGGIDLTGDDFAMTPEAGIEILQQRVSEIQRSSASWKTWGAATTSSQAHCADNDCPQRF